MKRLRTFLTAVVALAVLGATGFAAYRYLQPAAAPPAATVAVTRGELVETASASGTIEPHVQVEVKSRASGEVTKLMVQEGDEVKEGQLLIQLDPTDAKRAVKNARAAERRVRAQLAESVASMRSAKLEVDNAQVTQDLNQRGATLGLVSTETARSTTHASRLADANLRLRRAQVAAAQSQIETSVLDVEDAERNLVYTEIVAPMAGTVLSVGVEKGTIVSSALTNVSGGTAVLTLADLSDLRVIGQIDEAQVGRVAKGQPVTITVDAYPQRSFAGVVERVSPLGVTESSVVTFDVEIIVTDPDKHLLRSGMSADLEIVTEKHQGVLLLPLTAIQSKGAQRYVMLADGRSQPIETGANDGIHIVVLKGLAEGDRVVATPTQTTPASTSNQRRGGPMMGGPPPR